MNVIISSPAEYKNIEVVWLEINTPQGNFVIQEGHVPMIITLSENLPLSYRLKNGKQESIMISRGVASIDRHTATVIISPAQQP
jgi:ATP synthase, Delta/Epsilon chain, beta-sandwich domain.